MWYNHAFIYNICFMHCSFTIFYGTGSPSGITSSFNINFSDRKWNWRFFVGRREVVEWENATMVLSGKKKQAVFDIPDWRFMFQVCSLYDMLLSMQEHLKGKIKASFKYILIPNKIKYFWKVICGNSITLKVSQPRSANANSWASLPALGCNEVTLLRDASKCGTNF